MHSFMFKKSRRRWQLQQQQLIPIRNNKRKYNRIQVCSWTFTREFFDWNRFPDAASSFFTTANNAFRPNFSKLESLTLNYDKKSTHNYFIYSPPLIFFFERLSISNRTNSFVEIQYHLRKQDLSRWNPFNQQRTRSSHRRSSIPLSNAYRWRYLHILFERQSNIIRLQTSITLVPCSTFVIRTCWWCRFQWPNCAYARYHR